MNQAANYASIDIGSNSIRLLIMPADGISSGDDSLFRMEVTRLGAGLVGGGLSRDSIEKSAAVVARFVAIARERGVSDARILAFATAAVRDAVNGMDFIDRVYELCGIRPAIITGEREAYLAYLGVRSAYPSLERFGVLDIGGNSTEWLVMDEGRLLTASIPLGSGRLLRSFPACDAIPDAVMAEARERARSAFLRNPPPKADFWVGNSATITTAATINHRLADDSPKSVNGLVLSSRSLECLTAALADMPCEERKRLPGMHPDRADLLPFGLCIATAFMEIAGIDAIGVCANGNLHGAIIEAATNPVQPPIMVHDS